MRTFLAAAIAATLLFIAPVSAQADEDDGLRFEGATTFQLEPGKERVHVTMDVSITNQIPDSGFTYYYFDAISVPAPPEATNVSAVSSGGSTLSTNVETAEDSFSAVVVTLPFQLRYGQTQDLTVTYDLPDQPPRSEEWTRANMAYASFPVFAVGDAGLADVEVIIPNSYEPFVSNEDLSESEEGESLIFRASEIQSPEDWWAAFAAQNNKHLKQREVDVGSTTVELRHWPNDDEWADFMEEQLTTGLPALEKIIGVPFPDTDELAIMESGVPHVYGWGGWYDSEQDIIEVGDELEATVVFHELAHAWFNLETTSDIWLVEGLAETVAQMALEEANGSSDKPRKVSKDDDGAQPLISWVGTGYEPTPEDDYGYAASWWLLTTLAGEIGQEKFTAVVSAAINKTMPYGADEPVTINAGSVNWRHMLDLFQEVGGSEKAPKLYRTWVVAREHRKDLDDRAEARKTYAGLVEAGDGWSPPLELRDAMTSWRFGKVDDLVAASEEVLADRQTTLDLLDEYDIDDLPGFEATYESAKSVAELAGVADQYVSVAETLAEANDDPGVVLSTLADIGLIGHDLDDTLTDATAAMAAGEIDEADELATDAMDRVDDAPLQGGLRLGGALLILLIVMVLWRTVRRRRRRRAERARREAGTAEQPVLAGHVEMAADHPQANAPDPGTTEATDLPQNPQQPDTPEAGPPR